MSQLTLDLIIHCGWSGIHDGSKCQSVLDNRDSDSSRYVGSTGAFRSHQQVAERLQAGVRGSIPLVSTTLTSGNIPLVIH